MSDKVKQAAAEAAANNGNGDVEIAYEISKPNYKIAKVILAGGVTTAVGASIYILLGAVLGLDSE